MRYKKLHLAGCVILNKQGEILLLHRNTLVRKQWETPGGKLEQGESHRMAAEREIEEELGIDISIIKKLGHKDFIEDKFDDIKYFSWQRLQHMKNDLSLNTRNLVEAHFSEAIKLS